MLHMGLQNLFDAIEQAAWLAAWSTTSARTKKTGMTNIIEWKRFYPAPRVADLERAQ